MGIDAIWVRIAWAALALAGGIGVVAYLLGMYLFPRAEGEVNVTRSFTRGTGLLLSGLILVCFGALVILRTLGIMDYDFWAPWSVAFNVLWPITVIGGGAFLIYMYWRESSGRYQPFRRSADNRMLLGVCKVLGEFLRIDPNMVRFAAALFVVLTRGIGLVIYLLIGLLMPQAAREEEP